MYAIRSYYGLKTLAICLFLVAFITTIQAQNLVVGSPEKVGVNPERISKLDGFIQKYIDDDKVVITSYSIHYTKLYDDILKLSHFSSSY